MEIVLRVTFIFFFIWAITRALGKRELAEMTAFELVLLITIGDLVQQGATQDDTSVTGTVLTISTITLWVLIFSYIGFRWKRARTIVQGEAVMVVHNGRLLERVMKIERITANDVIESAREQGIDNIGDVHVGVLEADGRFSFLLRDKDPQHHQRAAIARQRTSG
jgi:uncharacterized membrane protein YcaP (DUF421 family)